MFVGYSRVYIHLKVRAKLCKNAIQCGALVNKVLNI
jgi:hypothetical protein